MSVSVGVCAHVWSPDNYCKYLPQDQYLPPLRMALWLAWSSPTRVDLAGHLHVCAPCPVPGIPMNTTMLVSLYASAADSDSQPGAWRQALCGLTVSQAPDGWFLSVLHLFGILFSPISDFLWQEAVCLPCLFFLFLKVHRIAGVQCSSLVECMPSMSPEVQSPGLE